MLWQQRQSVEKLNGGGSVHVFVKGITGFVCIIASDVRIVMATPTAQSDTGIKPTLAIAAKL